MEAPFVAIESLRLPGAAGGAAAMAERLIWHASLLRYCVTTARHSAGVMIPSRRNMDSCAQSAGYASAMAISRACCTTNRPSTSGIRTEKMGWIWRVNPFHRHINCFSCGLQSMKSWIFSCSYWSCQAVSSSESWSRSWSCRGRTVWTALVWR